MALSFPNDPESYPLETPWEDPATKLWYAEELPDNSWRWSAVPSSAVAGSSDWDDITNKPAAVTALSGTNTGNQNSIVGITGTKGQFQTAMTDDDFVTINGEQEIVGTKTFDQLNAQGIDTTSLVTGNTIFTGVNAFEVGSTFTYGTGIAALHRTALGLVIGTNVQAYDADLTSWAGISPASKADDSAVVHKTGTETIGGDKTFSGRLIGPGGGLWQLNTDGELVSNSISGPNFSLDAAGVLQNTGILTGDITGSIITGDELHSPLVEADDINCDAISGIINRAQFTGPTANRTFTLPDQAATLLYSGGALGTPSSGTLNLSAITWSGTGTASGLSIGGNAATATALANARTINGVSFDGTANIGQDLQTSASPTFAAVVGANFRQSGASGAGIQTNANGSRLSLHSNNTEVAYLSGSIFNLTSGGFLGWSGSAASAGSSTSGISQYAAGVTQFGTTTNNDSGSWRATNGTLLGTLTVTGASTLTGGIVGVITVSDAAAGNVGQIISSAVASGSAVSLTTATAANVTSISLTAGDWDVEGNINLAGSTATYAGASGGISSTTATVPTDGTEVFSGVQFTLLTATDGLSLPRKRINVSSTTTVYLVAKATFSAGTVGAFGSITARRVR